MRLVFGYTLPTLLLALVCSISCGKLSSPSAETGTIRALLRIESAPDAFARSATIDQTTWSALVVEIAGTGMNTIADTIVLSKTSELQSIDLTAIPSGTHRIVTAWTIDDTGDTIHAPASDTVTVTVNTTASAQLLLSPRCGSVYIELTGADASIDSVFISLTSASGAWVSRQKRGAKTYASLDKIPYGTRGILAITAVNSSGATVTSWTDSLFVFSSSNSTINASFINGGPIVVSIATQAPATTIIRGVLSTTDTLRAERAGADSVLIISEILFTGGSSTSSCDYVEIANPCPYPLSFDTLHLDLLTTSNVLKTITNIAVPAHGFALIANTGAPAAWGATTTLSLDLPSTSAQITLSTKRGVVLDRVFYENDLNIFGWPKLSSSAKTAVCIDSITSDPFRNNYGSHWKPAVSATNATTPDFLGTPGRSGL